jgi:isoleucyl-tRNA synthetase
MMGRHLSLVCHTTAHCSAVSSKTSIPRYQTMKGKRVERVWGWDCHGLPAERYTEKKLGIKSREEVIEYGIEKYIIACRENMVQTSSEWEDDSRSYRPLGGFPGCVQDHGQRTTWRAIWWAFKTLYEKGKIFTKAKRY